VKDDEVSFTHNTFVVTIVLLSPVFLLLLPLEVITCLWVVVGLHVVTYIDRRGEIIVMFVAHYNLLHDPDEEAIARPAGRPSTSSGRMGDRNVTAVVVPSPERTTSAAIAPASVCSNASSFGFLISWVRCVCGRSPTMTAIVGARSKSAETL
jgi:hypothetical protein